MKVNSNHCKFSVWQIVAMWFIILKIKCTQIQRVFHWQLHKKNTSFTSFHILLTCMLTVCPPRHKHNPQLDGRVFLSCPASRGRTGRRSIRTCLWLWSVPRWFCCAAAQPSTTRYYRTAAPQHNTANSETRKIRSNAVLPWCDFYGQTYWNGQLDDNYHNDIEKNIVASMANVCYIVYVTVGNIFQFAITKNWNYKCFM